MKRAAGFTSLLLLAAAVFLPTAGTAAGPGDTDAGRRPTNDSVRAYWTNQRIQRAIPREYTINDRGQVQRSAASPLAKPSRPGGGGDSSTVTGASWVGGGPVMEATGRAFFTMGGIDYTCSGAIAQESDGARAIVLTAGHCVYDEVADHFASQWMFIPNYDAGAAFFQANGGCLAFPGDCWVADRLVAPQLWAAGTSTAVNWEADFAFAAFTDAIEFDNAVPGYTLGSAGPTTSVHSFGYPASKKYNGTDLAYCAGPTVDDPFNSGTNWGLVCDMTGGSSGGPMIANFSSTTATPALVSLNSYRYIAGPNSKYMFGPRFSALTVATYHAALTASANELVP